MALDLHHPRVVDPRARRHLQLARPAAAAAVDVCADPPGSRSIALGAVAIVGAAAAAITLNVVLLGWASNQGEPVGRLTPRVGLPPPPAWAIRPAAGRPEDIGADD